MAILSTYPDDSATSSDDKLLTVDSTGATKLTTAATLKTYMQSEIEAQSIGAGVVKPEDLASGAGTTWVFQTGAPNATGFSSKSSDTLYYCIVGKLVFCYVFINGTSNGNGLTFTLPVAPKRSLSMGGFSIGDNGTALLNPGLLALVASSTTATAYSTHQTTSFPWTSSGGKFFQGSFFYEAA